MRVMTRMAIPIIALALGCGSNGTTGDAGEDTPADTGGEPDVAIDPACEYPAGPYGTAEGDIIDNLSFPAVGGGTASLRQFHCDSATRLLLMYGTAGWCPTCPVESADLPGIYADFHDQGLEIIAVVFEDEVGNPADLGFAEEYEAVYDFPFTTVADPDIQIGDYWDTSSAPINIFVDLNTMELISIDDSYIAGTFRTQIETLLASID